MTTLETLFLNALSALGGTAYGKPLRHRMEEMQGGKMVAVGALYATAARLETAGLIESRQGDEVYAHSGKPKRLFVLTGGGRRALVEAEGAQRVPGALGLQPA